MTTSQSLLLLETQSGSGYCLDTGRHHYYGVARDLGHYYVGVRNRPNTSPIPKDQEKGSILCFDQAVCFLLEIKPPFPIRDIHQILVYDGKLWVTCSFDNMIAVFDGISWDTWHPLGTSQEEPHDVNHFNSLTAFGNELCLVAHNWGATTGKLSELHFFRMPDRRWVRSIKLGSQAHNAWLHEGDLMTCSSAEGLLVSAKGKKIDTGGFPRGIAYVGDEIHVGISEFASRPDRDLGRGWIQVFDREWNLLRTLDMTGEGMVTDMLAISPDDAARILRRQNISLINYPVKRAG